MICLLAAVTALRAAAVGRRRLAAHDALLSLLRDAVAVALPSAAMHVDAAVGELPAEYSMPSGSEFAKLRPDLVCRFADAAGSDRVLVGEVTIVPPPALGRYYERKRSKYRRLCAATPGAQLLVVAVGTDGALHPESRAQLAMLVGSEARAADFAVACADIARERPGARRVYARATPPAPRAVTRRGRRRARDAVLRFEDMELQATTGGRGLYHLVAQLEDGDFVMYQEGSWCVDSVVVGPGDPPRLRAAMVDCVQVKCTQTCEHGVVHAFDAEVVDGAIVCREGAEEIDFGPEQLVARIPNGDGAMRMEVDEADELIGYVRDGTELPDRFLE